MMSNKRPIAALVAALFSVSGCKTLADVDSANLSAQGKVDSLIQTAKDSSVSGAVWRTEASKIAGEEIKVTKDEKLPDLFSRRFTFVTAAEPLTTVLEDISSRAGVRIVKLAGQSDGPAATPGSGPSGFVGQNRGGGVTPIALQWNESLQGLLDHIGQKTNASWRYANGVIEFFTEETRIFHLTIPRKPHSVSSSISLNGQGSGGGSQASGSSGGSGAASGSVSVSSSLTLDPYAAVVATVSSIIAQNGGVVAGSENGAAKGQAQASAVGGELPRTGPVVASREFGFIQVTARPAAMARVEKFIESVNRSGGRNVFINVEVYNVDVSKEESAGASMQAFYKQLGRFGASLQGSAVLLPSSGAQPGSFAANVTSASSPFSGSELVVQALRTIGETTLETNGVVMAVNGQPSPMQVANDVSFAAETSILQTPNVGSVTTTKQDSRVVGFTANFTPLIQGDNRILLETELTISSLKLTPSGPASAPVYSSNVSSIALQNSAFVNDGQSIVLFGYKQSRNAGNNNTSFGSFSQSGKQDKSIAVVVLTVFGGSTNEKY